MYVNEKLNEFNEYILGQKNNTFKVNTFEENCKIEKSL